MKAWGGPCSWVPIAVLERRRVQSLLPTGGVMRWKSAKDCLYPGVHLSTQLGSIASARC